ncbi:MAG: HupE/UreJ family protein [Reyranellaceae bacterium]
MKRQTGLSAFALALSFASPALAHTGVGETAGLMAGLEHPVFGLDHLLAMVAVGLWAGLVGGRAFWVWPAAFVGSMVLGGILGMNGVALPAIELVIVVSVIALGMATALDLKLHVVLGAAIIAVFGIAHGHAHGMEAPETGSGLTYAAGFVIATAALHGIGLGLAALTRTRFAARITRALGGLVALAGIGLLAS